jgi:hypothetical protein
LIDRLGQVGVVATLEPSGDANCERCEV